MAFIEKFTSEIPFVAHNFFGFDLFYFGNNLAHANYGDISSEIKLIDSLKFYQQSLRELSSTLTPEEKTAAKNLAEKFLNEHYYFSTVWAYLSVNKKPKILEIIAEGKGVTPYEIIVDMESFFIKPDKEF